MAYPTITDVKAYIGRTDTNADAKLTLMLARVIARVEAYCGQRFDSSANAVQTMNGDGGDLLRPALLPILTVTSITEDGVALTQGTDFEILRSAASGRMYQIKRLGANSINPWLTKPSSIVLTYTYGMAAIPDDIKGAIVEFAAIVANEKKFTFTTDEGVERTVIVTSIPESVQDILDSWRVPFI